MKTVFSLSLLALTLLPLKNLAAAPYPHELTALTSETFNIPCGESRRIRIPGGWRRVEKLYFSAVAYGGDATLKVLANDSEKGRVFIPRFDPEYVVTIAETTSEIILRNDSGRGTIQISSLKANLSSKTVYPIESDTIVVHPIDIDHWPHPLPFAADNEAARFARDAVNLVRALREYADPATEYVVFLLPIQTVAGRALALANAKGPGSIKVREQLVALAAQIAFADLYLESALKVNATFDLASRLISLEESILDWLD